MGNIEKLEADILKPALKTEEIKEKSNLEAGNEVELTTPQDSIPLEKASEETVEEIIEEIAKEIPQEEVQNADETVNEAIVEDTTLETVTDSTEETKDKTTKTETSENEVHKISAKKIGMLLTAGAVCVFSVGAIGLFSLINRGVDSVSKDNGTTPSNKAVTEFVQEPIETQEKMATMSWWKAGVEQYNIAANNAYATTTTTAVTTTVTTTTTKAETTTAAPETEYTVEDMESTPYYVAISVNFRKGAGANHPVIKSLNKGAEVTVIGSTNNGWLKVKIGETVGFINKDYLTATKPVTTTKAPTTTAKPVENIASKPSDTMVVSCSAEELEMFYYVVEGEVGGCSEASKIAVANVIINRVKNGRFPGSLSGVMTSKSQFTAINNYYSKRRTPTQSTKDCVQRALYGEDNTNGAIYFYSKKYCSASSARWFESLNFCFEIDGQ
ncbi:MAG: cell wall hydrolase, partial [Clostridiales bacterium]|nr:cell wall hydrolase [Clostridiales bacterium]